MSIGKNIAKYRKALGLTQEELGAKLGVTNQAVSKWEQEISIPDIMLLPEIAKILSVSLYQLYGIENNAFSFDLQIHSVSEIQQILLNMFCRLTECHKFPIDKLVKFNVDDKAKFINCIDNNHTLAYFSADQGTFFISNSLSIILSDNSIFNHNLFDNLEIVAAMQKLSDPRVRRILSSLFDVLKKDLELTEKEFTFDEIGKLCNLTNEDLMYVLEQLAFLEIIEITHQINEKIYVFRPAKLIETTIVLYSIERLVNEHYRWRSGTLTCNSF